jgi:hypothetical protein
MLNAFETCAKRFFHTSIAKDLPEPKSEHQKWGDAVHAALAARIMYGTMLPPGMEQYEGQARAVTATNHAILCEQKLAVTSTHVPCDYFDRMVPVWCRATIDVVKFFPEVNAARIIDWKTGKRPGRGPDETQMLVNASMALWHWPSLDGIKADFIWLQTGQVDTFKYHRDEMQWLWAALISRVDRMKHTIDSYDFPPNPSGLCRKHCHIASCPYHGSGSL